MALDLGNGVVMDLNLIPVEMTPSVATPQPRFLSNDDRSDTGDVPGGHGLRQSAGYTQYNYGTGADFATYYANWHMAAALPTQSLSATTLSTAQAHKLLVLWFWNGRILLTGG